MGLIMRAPIRADRPHQCLTALDYVVIDDYVVIAVVVIHRSRGRGPGRGRGRPKASPEGRIGHADAHGHAHGIGGSYASNVSGMPISPNRVRAWAACAAISAAGPCAASARAARACS